MMPLERRSGDCVATQETLSEDERSFPMVHGDKNLGPTRSFAVKRRSIVIGRPK
jgi:hypothetical protein